MTALEKDIEKGLGRMIGRAGGLCLKWVCPGFAGVPDRICVLPGGNIIFVELKRPKGGVVAARQEWWAAKLRSLGFVVLLIRNTDEINQLKFFINAVKGGMENAGND